jgi:beta-lactamase regulating signal transducer with metallopeptidase domain
MSAVLIETLAWTGVLIAAVLLARRPVARLCGPQVAYALWALPLIRLVLPPLTLPAWMAPAPAAAPVAEQATRAALAEPLAWQAESVPATFTVAAPPPAEPGFDLLAQIAALPLAEALLLLWLGGAGVFLWRRFAAYFALRDELLAEGREVGGIPARLGAIRLVETPGTRAPIAFGVLDPVIALPPGFMALPDRRARDLALAHELAHHRGLDLVINIAVQPLFALHWFNPLGHYGWLALRRDQEAACDARVIAASTSEERAAYARLIAGFATGAELAPRAALAAPMACPVLGEKSIIHRLRSLSMSHMSPRRRLAGRALLAAGVLALPLTASISYAARTPGSACAARCPRSTAAARSARAA